MNTDVTGPAPPDTFGPFRVLHQVGAGTLGPVFRAYDAQGERLVAVKLFRLDLPPERAHRLVAELEALIAAPLGHPAIVVPIAAGLAGNDAYFAQEFVVADSLDVVMRDYGPAPLADALQAAAHLASALDFAAVVEIEHGALHPRDVLITHEARLTGIGIARALERVGVVPPVRRPYTAPERIAGARWDRRADVFSLAALAFELVTGTRISGTGADAAAGLPILTGVDPVALREVFARGLAENPDERFATCLAFVEALGAACLARHLGTTETEPAKRGADIEPAKSETPQPRRSSPARPGRARPTELPLEDSGVAAGDAVPPESSAAVPSDSGAAVEKKVAAPKTVEPSAPALPPEPFASMPPPPIAAPDAEPLMRPMAPRDVTLGASAADLDLHHPEAALGDLELRAAEESRFDMVETAPSVPQSATEDASLPAARTEPEPVVSRIAVEPATRPSETQLPEAPQIQSQRIAPLASSQARRPAVELQARFSEPESSTPPVAAVREDRLGPASWHTEPGPAVPVAADQHERTGFWTIALALVVGIALGFAGGYTVGMRQRPLSVVEAPATSTPPGDLGTTPAPVVAGARPGVQPEPPAGSTGSDAPKIASGTTPSPSPAPPAAASGGRPVVSAPATSAGAALLVRSTPEGARVTVNGEDRGRTPVTIRDLPPGTHRVRLEREGYVPVERRAVIKANRAAAPLTVTLTRVKAAAAPAPKPAPARPQATPSEAEQFEGELALDSRPSGARVYLDGRLIGTTPMLVPKVRAGEHLVRLERDGYRRWSSSVRVQSGERNRVTASLER